MAAWRGPGPGRSTPARPLRVTALCWIGGIALAFTLATTGLRWHSGSLAGWLLWIGLGILPVYLIAVWLARRRPDHPQTLRLLVLGTAGALGTCVESVAVAVDLTPTAGGIVWVNLLMATLGTITAVSSALVFATYPDGLVEHGWQRVFVRAAWVMVAMPLLAMVTNVSVPLDPYLAAAMQVAPQDLASPLAVPAATWLGPAVLIVGNPLSYVVVALCVLGYRFLTAPREQRRRMRILVYPMLAGVPVLAASVALRLAGLPEDAPAVRVVNAFFLPLLLALPVSIVVGVLRYRLYDLDILLRRSVVYWTLTVGIAAVYIGLAVAPGLALGDQIPVQLAVLLTIVAAVAFQPLRTRLDALVDRWVFGERVNRYRLLTDFGGSLERTIAVADLLPALADTVRRGLGAPWVRVTLTGMDDAVAGTVVRAGGPLDSDPDEPAALCVPLLDRARPSADPAGSRGEPPSATPAGMIECGPRAGGYDDQDRELLTTLAGQAAAAIGNVRLSAALAERLSELESSRSRLVTAADAERRRIERDIHDGVQQQVVALMLQIRLARNQVGRGDRTADEAFEELAVGVRELLVDLRELAHGIHPPVLSDGGLVAAVEARTARLPFDVTVTAHAGVRDRRFGDDVEGAAYYVVCEALTNVAKHAGGTATEIDLSAASDELSVMVSDRGAGFVANGSGRPGGPDRAGGAGHGLTNLRDRVEALGGLLVIDSVPGRGTRVQARLPLAAYGGGRG